MVWTRAWPTIPSGHRLPDVVAIANLAGCALFHLARDGGPADLRQVNDMLKPVTNPIWLKVRS